MRSRDRRPSLARRRRLLAGLVAGASLLGLGGGGTTARAQEDTDEQLTGEAMFGAYQLDATGTGVQVRYDIQGLLPGGAPVIDLTIPQTVTRFGSGPLGYGLAGLAYPGPLLANLGTLMAQTGFGAEDSVPPWPIKAEAFYPTGPTDVDESVGPAVQRVVSDDFGVQAQGIFPAVEADPVLVIESISAASRSVMEGEAAVSRSRVVLGGVKVLGGLITIDSLVTDLVAAHDGTTGSTSGGTTAAGVKFLGLAASLTEDGLVLAEAPPLQGPAGPLGDLLDPLIGPLNELTAPVRDLVSQVLDQAVPQLNDLLANAGLSISLVEPHETQAASGAAVRTASGLSINLTYEGKEQLALGQLIDSIPPDLRPGLGPIPNPISFLVENHIADVTLGAGSVSALATPQFPMPDVVGDPAPPVDAGPGFSVDLGDPGFSTPLPALPEAPAAPDTGRSPAAPATEPASNTTDGAVPAILVALAILASPLFGLGSSRLADNVLAPVSTSCPSGLDQPPAPARPT